MPASSASSAAAQPATAAPPTTAGEVGKKARKPKLTFMLHAPDMSSLGKYVSTDYRYAALKVASRGHKRILLRRTNTKEIREFAGDVVELDQPKEIHRGDRVIRYSKRPTVKHVKTWTYEGNADLDTSPVSESFQPAPAADVVKKRTKRAPRAGSATTAV